MAKVRSHRDALLADGRASLSVNTLRSYQNAWRGFQRWCRLAGRGAHPASGDTLALYVTWLLQERGRRISTAESHIAAVLHFHRFDGVQLPALAETRDVIGAVRRTRRERPRGKKAIEPAELLCFAQACDPSTPLGARDRAIVVLGFASGLRRSELAALQLGDVAFEARGLVVSVQYSKTDQEGRGRVHGVWPGRRACTDPVRVLGAWLRKRGAWDGPLFCRVQTGGSVTREPLHGDAISAIVKRMAAAAGKDASRYGAHSLRAGAVTASAELGRGDQEIMRMSGHASAVVMRQYVRHAQAFSGRNPLAGVL